MTTATRSTLWAWLAMPRAQATTGPERQKRRGPIFIHDAVVPWKGSTLLCEILLTDEADAEDSPGP